MTAPANTEATPGRLSPAHIPVLLPEVLDALQPTDGAIYVDATFGAGGYSRALLDAADCTVIATDRDPAAVAQARDLIEAYAPRLKLHRAPFSKLDDAVQANAMGHVDGVVFDLGVSSMQLDQAERGFSFLRDGPLDMRMFARDGQSAAPCDETGPAGGLSARDVVNAMDEQALADLIYELGEEKRSRAIARAIVHRRRESPFATTKELADTVARVVKTRGPAQKHPATRTFQALRLYVNDELGQLRLGLVAAERVLKPGGRLVVVTFHSLEDRIVKQFLNARSGRVAGPSRHAPQVSVKLSPPSFRIVNSRPLTPSKGELDVNPRARSARLRIAERTDAPMHKA